MDADAGGKGASRDGGPRGGGPPQDDAIIGKAFRWSLAAILLIGAVVAGFLLVGREEGPEATPVIERGSVALPRPTRPTAGAPPLRFTDITQDAGIRFVHVSGATGAKLLPETMGGGVAFLDHDGDGDQDLLFVNSGHWPEDASARQPTMALYANDGRGRFEEVTAGSGLDIAFYGQGVATGDHDGDGDVDVFLTALGANRLLRNDGGRFVDVTARARVGGDAGRWSTSAGFFDQDNDGDLDLFVCNYVRWSRQIDLELNFTLNGRDRAYGPPKQYEGTHSYLYRNNGDGTFTDISESAGIQVSNSSTGKPVGKALAVTFADIDRDGFMDILVANDTVQNFAFRNIQGERFEDLGVLSGIGFDSSGNATGAMGTDAADFANTGVLGIGMANFANEHTSFYVQQTNPWLFVDSSSIGGIGSASMLSLSFGLFFFDADLDGRLDLLQANGHLEEEINQIQPSMHYRQPAQLFWNCSEAGRTCFEALPDAATGALATPVVGRGAAYADIDGDGDLDVLIAQNNGSPLLLRNDQETDHHWLRVRLRGTRDNGDAIGAEIELQAGGSTQRRRVMPTRSYLSQVELPVTFGIGKATRVDSLVVRWPDGSEQIVPVEATDREIDIIQE